jgi:hypothetical protein
LLHRFSPQGGTIVQPSLGQQHYVIGSQGAARKIAAALAGLVALR